MKILVKLNLLYLLPTIGQKNYPLCMKIGVYGLGRFGSFWAESLSGTGNEVIAYSRSKHIPPKGVRIAGEEEVLNSDLLFFSVAISSFEDVLEKVGKKIGKNTIAMDTCSVKKYPMEWMENNIPGDIYTIGTHPMFGPDSGKNGLAGLPIVMCPMKEIDNRYKKVKDLFLSMGLKVIEMTGDDHDRDAAFSQGVTHFIGRVLKEMNLEEKEIATKGYISLLEIVEQTCHDPLQLFYDLQRYNPYTRDMRHALRIALENVGYRLENGEKA